MPGVRRQGEEIRSFILQNVTVHKNIAALTAKEFGISLPAVYKHISRLVSENLVEKNNGRFILQSKRYTYSYKNISGLSEDAVWEKDIKKHFFNVSENVRHIWVYGFLEIFNNAIEHSKGNGIRVNIDENRIYTAMEIFDNGIGIFKNIKNKYRLLEEKDALLELVKGKRSTDRARHSGQGIFFTSKIFDRYMIMSGGISFIPKSGTNISVKIKTPRTGSYTSVYMQLANDSEKILKNLFDEFSTEIPGSFDKTVVPVHFTGSDDLVSRSQARRILSGLELFKEAILDFQDIKYIGQAFADEIFRVFPKMNPDTKIAAINANDEIQSMINRAINTRI